MQGSDKKIHALPPPTQLSKANKKVDRVTTRVGLMAPQIEQINSVVLLKHNGLFNLGIPHVSVKTCSQKSSLPFS